MGFNKSKYGILHLGRNNCVSVPSGAELLDMCSAEMDLEVLVDYRLTPGWPGASSVSLRPRRLMDGTEGGQQGREMLFPSALPWGGCIWSTAPGVGLPSSRQTGNCWRLPLEGHRLEPKKFHLNMKKLLYCEGD